MKRNAFFNAIRRRYTTITGVALLFLATLVVGPIIADLRGEEKSTSDPGTPGSPPKREVSEIKVEELRTMTSDALEKMAKQFAAERKTADALQTYRVLVEKDPARLAARNELAALLTQTRDFPAAAEEFAEIVRRDPKNAEAHHRLGVALYQAGKTNQGIAELVEALRLKADLLAARK